MYTLIIEDKHGGIADEYSFEEGEFYIGRSHTSDIILPSDNVSRRHARLYTVDGKCYIEDLNSSNGVFVNGRRIQEVYQIQRSAQIKVGDYYLHIESDADQGAEEDKTFCKLTGRNLAFANQVFRVQRKVNLMGRGKDCTLTIIDPSVSRIHAKLSIERSGALTLEDLKSSNGTFVNDEKIEVATLSHRDVIRIGNVEFLVELPDQDTVLGPPPKMDARDSGRDKPKEPPPKRPEEPKKGGPATAPSPAFEASASRAAPAYEVSDRPATGKAAQPTGKSAPAAKAQPPAKPAAVTGKGPAPAKPEKPQEKDRPERVEKSPDRADRPERVEKSADKGDRPERVDRHKETIDQPERVEKPLAAAASRDGGSRPERVSANDFSRPSDAPMLTRDRPPKASLAEELWPDEKPGGSKTIWIVAIVSLLVVTGIILFVFKDSLFGSSAEKPPETVATTTPPLPTPQDKALEEQKTREKKQREIAAIIEKGNEAIKEKNWEFARERFEVVLELDPLNDTARSAVNRIIAWQADKTRLEDARRLRDGLKRGEAAKKLREIADTSVYYADAQQGLLELMDAKGTLELNADTLLKAKDCNAAVAALREIQLIDPKDLAVAAKIEEIEKLAGTRKCKE